MWQLLGRFFDRRRYLRNVKFVITEDGVLYDARDGEIITNTYMLPPITQCGVLTQSLNDFWVDEIEQAEKDSS